MSGSRRPLTSPGEEAEPTQVVALDRARGGSPDARLLAFVRLLARQVARDYHAQARREAEPPDD